jgi:ferredoxin
MFGLERKHRNLFKEIYKSERLSELKHLGVKVIEIAKIKGSVNRWRNFDQRFRIQDADKNKIRSVTEALEKGVQFPPISVYKVKSDYYIIDGNHRVAACKKVGQVFIDADVYELLPPADTPEHKFWRERSRFEWKTGLTMDLSVPGSYERLLVYIRLFAKQSLKKTGRQLNSKEAAEWWTKQVYQPVIELIRQRKFGNRYPNHTEDELFLFIIHHQLIKSRLQGREVNVLEAVNDFCNQQENVSFDLLDLLKGMVFRKQCADHCLSCATKCPEGLICLSDGRMMVSDNCEECGACTDACPERNIIPYAEYLGSDSFIISGPDSPARK